MTPIAEIRVPVVLDKPRELTFNANTMAAYEQEMRRSQPEDPKSYWETMLKLYEYVDKYGEELRELGRYDKTKEEPREISARRLKLGVEVMRYISTTEIRTLLWAALHDYDDRDEPTWDREVATPARLGRMIKPQDTVGFVYSIFAGHGGNAPSKRELGEASGGAETEKQTDVLPAEKTTHKPQRVNGGLHTIELPADAFA